MTGVSQDFTLCVFALSAVSLITDTPALASEPVNARDYGELHYFYAGALGDQGCADVGEIRGLKRRYAARFAERVGAADRWFAKRYAPAILSATLETAYGGPGSIDIRDCHKTSNGDPEFRDVRAFEAKLRVVEHHMRRAD